MLFPRPGRLEWYDRAPVARVQAYAAGSVAPHASTERWSYTVPSGKKFVLQLMANNVKRDGVATAAAGQQSWLEYTPSGGGANNLFYALNYGNALNDGEVSIAGGTMVLLASDKIAGRTLDSSTGGTGVFNNGMQGLEFDA